MSEIRTGEPPILFNDAEISFEDVIPEMSNFLESKELSPKEKKELTVWFQTEIQRITKRKIDSEGGKKPDKTFLNATLTSALGKLEILANQIIIARERDQERLNPFLLTKSGLRKSLESSREGKEKEGTIFVLVNIDLDDFKTINDNYGHNAGDEVLRSFGRALESSVRPDDSAAHYSGDEFGILLSFTPSSEIPKKDIELKIKIILERIISSIQEKVKRPDGKKQELSVGYRVITSSDKGEFEDFHNDADGAAEMSKVIRIIEEGGGRTVESTDRILSIDGVKEIVKQYADKDLKSARTIRTMRRVVLESYPDISTEELTQTLQEIIEKFEKKG